MSATPVLAGEDSGISFTIKTAPVNSVLAQTPPCTPTSRSASGSCPSSAPRAAGTSPPIPTGDSLFQTGGGSNFGNYSNPEVDKLITAATTSTRQQAIQDYSAALAKDLPVVWLPEPDYQISVVKYGLAASPRTRWPTSTPPSGSGP